MDESSTATTVSESRTGFSSRLKDESRRIGFDLVGIAPAVTPTGFHEFHAWLKRGYAGEMEYLPRREADYEHPEHVLDGVRSIIMLGVNYHSEKPPRPSVGKGVQGRVSRYAWGSEDYHDVLKEKLYRLGDVLHGMFPGCRTRGVVDTAPLLERDFARLAGLGWFGKNTMLINKHMGSWLFLAALLTDVELEYDRPHETSHCGTCTRCLEACPTDAFPEPYVLDARKCISYLNIELCDPVPTELREGMGDWLFGCDICQEVCPWNNKAPYSSEPAFQPAEDLASADAVAMLRLSEEQFRQRFRHTPLWRPKRAGVLRNAAIVLGNVGDERAIPVLMESLHDSEPLVRGAVAWALGKLGGREAKAALQSRSPLEENVQVLDDIQSALSMINE